MRRATTLLADFFLLLESPLGFIFVVGISVAFLLVENTGEAFSQQENNEVEDTIVVTDIPEGTSVNGLVFEKDSESVDFSFGVIPSPTPTSEPTPSLTPPTPVEVAVAQEPTKSPLPTAIPVTPTPVLTAIPTPTTPPPPVVDAGSDGVWDRLAQCESGGNWNINTGNGYYGGLQFSQGAWESAGGTGNPADASQEEQIARGKQLQAMRGWGAWGTCASNLGLR